MRTRPERYMLPRVIPLIVATIAFLGQGSTTIAQGCTSSSALADESTRGNVRGFAITRQDDCANRKTMVWMRVVNLEMNCEGQRWDTS